MGSPYFFAGREPELRALIHRPDHKPLDRQLRWAGCGTRLACLALALRAEDPDARGGWYGGLSPSDRDNVAATLGLETPKPPASDRAVQAARLQAAGWTVEDIATALGCSRRTVQRYLRTTAA